MKMFRIKMACPLAGRAGTGAMHESRLERFFASGLQVFFQPSTPVIPKIFQTSTEASPLRIKLVDRKHYPALTRNPTPQLNREASGPEPPTLDSLSTSSPLYPNVRALIIRIFFFWGGGVLTIITVSDTPNPILIIKAPILLRLSLARRSLRS